MKKKFILLFLAALSLQVSISQTIDSVKLDDYFNALEENNKFMGSVSLKKDGEIIYTKQIGFSDIETKKKPDDNTKYRIGSISKTFTAALVFRAIEEGKIKLEQTIEGYFPTVKNSNLITIANLLNHRSGIYNFTNDEAYLEYNTEPKSEEEMLSIISKYDSAFEPNSKSEYSNSNYVLLSFILEKLYKKSFAEILSEKIVDPIGLKNTYFGGKIDIEKNEANSYKGDWEKQSETDMSIPLGAGGIVSTPTDILLFAEALFNYKIISEESVTQMQTLKDNYGMGLFKMPFYEKYSFGHTGGIDGFSSMFGYFPEEKSAFALTSNGSNFNNNDIAIALLSALFNRDFTVPSFETYEVSSDDLEMYLGVYSSPSFPLKISITKSGAILMAQATGQPSFNLDATEKDKFKFDQAGIVMEFDPANNQMTLKQGGGVFVLTKE
ncbi:serine hydrolase domain-containing protein [Arenibacter latericius]|uniref:serine hydrolase domain-containing protein n=1 Tax=Arenibacter latericius TaxID=86104 RepID=UPI0004179AC6|nr:serine hydrolase domain-containing protein [Arenibacter latericius]